MMSMICMVENRSENKLKSPLCMHVLHTYHTVLNYVQSCINAWSCLAARVESITTKLKARFKYHIYMGKHPIFNTHIRITVINAALN